MNDQVLFWIFAILAGGGAIGVVILQDIVRMAFSLIISLGSTAGLFFLLDADFVAATQLLVYVGGTLVLLIFGVMLTSQEKFVSMKTSQFDWTLAVVAGLCLLAVLISAAVAIPEWKGLERAEVESLGIPQTATPLGMGLLGARVDAPTRSGYLLVFEIVSIHLLVVLVGAAYLARAKRKRSVAVG